MPVLLIIFHPVLPLLKSPFVISSAPNSLVLLINPCAFTNVASEFLVNVKSVAIVLKSKSNVAAVGVGYVKLLNSASVNASFQTPNAFVFPKKGCKLSPLSNDNSDNPIGIAPDVSVNTSKPFIQTAKSFCLYFKAIFTLLNMSLTT